MIYKVEPNLPTATKITSVNDMVMEVNGKTAGAAFDKNELDQIFTEFGMNRKYVRDESLGHSVTDYTAWTHVQTEGGYSIWKYTLSDYAYNSVNQLFFDDKLLAFRGEANSESATTFYKAFYYDGTYTDETTEAGTEGGVAFTAMSGTTDYLYLGEDAVFNGLKAEFATRGTNYTLKVEYYSSGIWTELTSESNNLVDNTSDFASDGTITWEAPTFWGQETVNGYLAYWVRISTTTTPITAAMVNYIIPNNSVVGLLALSSTQIQNEEWAWCSFGSTIYVTIRNLGNAAYEGNFFINSSSSDANKRNFFIYNHEFKANYENASFIGDTISFESGVTVGDLVYISDQYTFNKASANSWSRRAIGVVESSGVVKYVSGLVKRVNTVGAGNIVPGNTLYLSTTAGKVTRTPATGAGTNIQQIVGTAISYEYSGARVDMIMSIQTAVE